MSKKRIKPCLRFMLSGHRCVCASGLRTPTRQSRAPARRCAPRAHIPLRLRLAATERVARSPYFCPPCAAHRWTPRVAPRPKPTKGPALLPWSVPVTMIEPMAALSLGENEEGDHAQDVRYGASVHFFLELVDFARPR